MSGSNNNDNTERSCTLHANVFRLMNDFKQLPYQQQMRVHKYVSEYIHDRHVIHALLYDWLNNGGKKDNDRYDYDDDDDHDGLLRSKKRRKIYKLVDSSSSRSVAKIYERYLSFLNGHRNVCRLMIVKTSRNGTTADTRDDEYTDDRRYGSFAYAVPTSLEHVSYYVHTNYSSGSDTDMREDELRENPMARFVSDLRFVSVDACTLDYPDVSRALDTVVTLQMMDVVRRRSAHYSSSLNAQLDGSSELIVYLKQPIHRMVVKLLDFVFFEAEECWSLWNDVLDRCLSIHSERSLYPIKDSLYEIVMIQDDTNATVIASFHTHGLLTKLGTLVDFVNSFRLLMRYSILCCCYGMKRQAVHRMNYTRKHECCWPAASQGVYHELFLTSKQGHDLLCNLSVNCSADAFKWLATFEQTRDMLCTRKKIRYTDRLKRHLNELEPTYGGFFNDTTA